jgi:cbb3-type cytochrome oxidase subunit 1
MPRLSVWFIRLSLVYLTLGFTFGGLLLLNKGLPLSPLTWRLLPAHIEFVLFGWTVQLVMGMAFWILPRFAAPPVRGNEKLAWTALFLINIGIWLLAVSVLVAYGPWMTLFGRLAQAVGVIAFAIHAWPRIKGV